MGTIARVGFRPPAFMKLKERFSLASLAVRIVLTYPKNGNEMVVFQKRSAANNTYRGAWDVSAAGYIRPSEHTYRDT